MKKPLVTILSPVYNGETYIEYFLNSLLALDYPNMEFILINDGSNDGTDEIIKSYEQRLKKKFKRYVYKTTKNQGQAGAINDGLKLVKGKYLIWPDSDDLLTKNSIACRVDFLENNPEYKFIQGQALAYDENNLTKPLYKYQRIKKMEKVDNIFINLLLDKDIYFVNGCYMIDFASFKEIYPTLDIIVERGGQNWQMLLPFSYYHKCAYIKEVVYKYVIRENSHSHTGIGNFAPDLNRINEHENIINNILEFMDIPKKEKDEYFREVLIKYSRMKLDLAIKHLDNHLFEENYKILEENNGLDNFIMSLKNISKKKRLTKYKNQQRKEQVVSIPKRVINKMKKVVSKYEEN